MGLGKTLQVCNLNSRITVDNVTVTVIDLILDFRFFFNALNPLLVRIN